MKKISKTKITKASLDHAELLSQLGARTFYQSHKGSAPAYEIKRYMKKVYNIDAIKSALNNPDNIYHLIQYEDIVVGFSRIELAIKHPQISLNPVTKMDQIYLDESAIGRGFGATLLHQNITYSKLTGENGMWLVVWAHNYKAITVYEKFGFRVIANDTFQLTDTHQSPCYIMLLDYLNDS